MNIKSIKNDDVAVKFEIGTKLYEAGKYKAIRLLSKLHLLIEGKQAEKLFYMFSQAYYKTEQYYLAGYQFESFASGYPKSEKIQKLLI
jgi:outer membrane protein assembly factor BamD